MIPHNTFSLFRKTKCSSKQKFLMFLMINERTTEFDNEFTTHDARVFSALEAFGEYCEKKELENVLKIIFPERGRLRPYNWLTYVYIRAAAC